MDPSLPFSRPYRVRFDEAGADGHARVSTLVRYIQDLAWQHSDAVGFDRPWYAVRGLGWLVRGQELEVLRDAWYGEQLTLTTQVIGWRRMWARRRCEVAREDGTPLVRAHIDWVLLDVTAGRPVRIPKEIEAFAPEAAAFTPVRVDLPEAPPDATRVPTGVRASDVDPLGHLNNAGYLDLLEEALLTATGTGLRAPTTLRLEYLQPATPGTPLESVLWATEGGWAYRLVDPSGPTDLLRATAGRSGQAAELPRPTNRS
ncbi:MAG: thioesterase [Chloroflexota bacterium]